MGGGFANLPQVSSKPRSINDLQRPHQLSL
jgi:hypothetical protein